MNLVFSPKNSDVSAVVVFVWGIFLPRLYVRRGKKACWFVFFCSHRGGMAWSVNVLKPMATTSLNVAPVVSSSCFAACFQFLQKMKIYLWFCTSSITRFRLHFDNTFFIRTLDFPINLIDWFNGTNCYSLVNVLDQKMGESEFKSRK